MRRPNLLVIMSDQHTPSVLGAYGNAQVRTPNLDRMAADGVVFENAYCNNPICVPSFILVADCNSLRDWTMFEAVQEFRLAGTRAPEALRATVQSRLLEELCLAFTHKDGYLPLSCCRTHRREAVLTTIPWRVIRVGQPEAAFHHRRIGQPR